MKYSNIILFSDLDGTLLNSQMQVSEENRKAIEEFVSQGGRFGVATGRGLENAMSYLDGIPFNYYSIFLNGALLYDMRINEKVENDFLDKEQVIPLIKRSLEKYPTLGIQIYLEDEAYFVSPRETTPHEVVQGHLDYDFIHMDELQNKEWLKLFFYGQPEELKLVEEDSNYLIDAGVVDGIYTTANYYELLPKDCNKGKMISRIHQLKDKQDMVYAVGDFYNDVEMIDQADVGIYTENAPEDLKKRVKWVCAECNENAISDVIHRIIDESTRSES